MMEQEKLNLLIAEDTPIQGKKLKFYLEKFGYNVDWAKDGKEAWDLFQENFEKYKLVITDVQMPNMDGLEFLELIKTKSAKEYIPVIVLTTLKDEETLFDALNKGASEFLNKPFRPQELKLRTQNLVALSQFQEMMLDENQDLNDQLKEKNKILESQLFDLNEAHDKLKDMKSQLVHSSKKSAIGVMGAGIAHEINNPLAIIDGYNERLNSILQKQNIEKSALEKINVKIRNSTERIRQVVLHMKNFAHGTKDENAQKQVFDLNLLLGGLKDFFGERQQENGINIQFRLANEPIYIKGIPAIIEHALFNIVHNAFDAVEETMEKTIVITLQQVNGQATITVKDSGKGIMHENLGKIFDPFYTTKEIGQGMGLGLSIARSYLEDSGAEIECESEPERGTNFKISIPVQEAA